MTSKLVTVTAISAIALTLGAVSTASAGNDDMSKMRPTKNKMTEQMKGQADKQMSHMKRMKQMEMHQNKMGTEKSHMGAAMGKKGMSKEQEK